MWTNVEQGRLDHQVPITCSDMHSHIELHLDRNRPQLEALPAHCSRLGVGSTEEISINTSQCPADAQTMENQCCQASNLDAQSIS